MPIPLAILAAAVALGSPPVLPFPAAFTGVARYTRFRRFTVSTEENVALPPP
jgi:hypothetical protein